MSWGRVCQGKCGDVEGAGEVCGCVKKGKTTGVCEGCLVRCKIAGEV